MARRNYRRDAQGRFTSALRAGSAGRAAPRTPKRPAVTRQSAATAGRKATTPRSAAATAGASKRGAGRKVLSGLGEGLAAGEASAAERRKRQQTKASGPMFRNSAGILHRVLQQMMRPAVVGAGLAADSLPRDLD